MTKNKSETLIIVRDLLGPVPYWAADETLPMARNRFKRLTGKFPSNKAIVRAFKGPFKEINRIMVDDMGSISYPKSVVMVNIQN